MEKAAPRAIDRMTFGPNRNPLPPENQIIAPRPTIESREMDIFPAILTPGSTLDLSSLS